MIELEKTKDLDKYIEYVNAQRNYTLEDLKTDLARRGLTEQEIDYVMTFYKPAEKQGMFKHPFSFKGRIRRLEFGLSYLLVQVLFLPINITPENQVSEGMVMFYLLLSFPASWFMWAQLCKRFHDRGCSGTYIFFLLIPIYNLYLICMQIFADGDKCDNKYGSSPKRRN